MNIILKHAIKSLAYYIIVSICWLDVACANVLDDDVKDIFNKKGDINFAAYVIDADSGKQVLSIHPKRLFVPASITKIVTGYFALKKLGLGYRYYTTLSYNIFKLRKNKLVTNIYLKFTGDPTLTEQDLYDLLLNIKNKSVKEISSNIVVNDSFFDNYWTSAGGFTWDDRPFCNAAPKSAIIVNENCGQAYQWPGKVGEGAGLEVTSPYILSLYNDVKTVSRKKQNCEYKSKYLGGNKYQLYGCMHKKFKRTKLNFALPNNRKMIRDYILHWLKKENIKFTGKIVFRNKSGKKILASHESQPLSDIVKLSLKDSNNLVAGAIYKTVSAKYLGGSGSDENSSKLLGSFLKKLGLNTKYIKLYGGSGESRYNQISTNALVDLLKKIYEDKKIFPTILEDLPIHAKEGTLKYRKSLGKHSKRIRAKSGSLKNASAIAGYYLGKKKYIFAIMMNNQNIPYVEAKKLEDEVLKHLFSQLAG